MEESLYIEKTRNLREDQDYNFLRGEGLKYIEELCSKLWTDYNSHDPGITILEALCYAITELGYRTGFDVKDLMADQDGKIDADQAFFSAKNILSSAPLTVEDYRKLLVDTIGVKNAWLYPYRDEDATMIGESDQEVALFAHCKKDKLVFQETEHPISLHGLYQVLLDLEETDEFGDLNKGDITWQFAAEGLTDIRVQVLFPDWRGTETIDPEFVSAADPASISNIEVAFSANRWTVKFDIENGADKRQFQFKTFVLLKKDVSAIEPLITSELNNSDVLSDIFSIYQKKINLVISILNEVKQKLHANRNLCEDFIEIKTICSREIAFCADIEVKPEVDIEEVYANVLFQLENYLNPEVKFYSLKELLNEGMRTDEIFEGPILTHGFIKTDELNDTQVRNKIFVSDIINFIMDTEGVLSVKNVLLTKYDDSGEPVLPSDRWCMEIEEGCKPALNVFRSKVLFFKGKLPFRPRIDETLDMLKYLHGLEQRNKLKGTADDLEIPEGNFRDISDYLSIHYEFPVTYGIGDAGLPSNASAERIAQAKQLKAYLLFYDQLLANFFSQLSKSKELFSLSTSVKQTYFGQYLKEIPGVEEIYSSPSDLEKTFAAPDPGDSESVKKLRALLLESSDTFYDRRNRFLDHLIARFAESFNEYVLMLYSYKNADDYQEIDADELIKDKISFLKDYPVISRERGTGFDYLQPSWHTDNVSGLEKRVARLAGIDNFNRRFLFCLKHIEIRKTNSVPAKYFFKVIDKNGTSVIESLKEYESYLEIQEIVDKLAEVSGDPSFYKPEDISATEFSFQIISQDTTPLAKSATIYLDAASRDAAISDIASSMNDDCPEEGMHLIEHILLRPRFEPPVMAGTDPEDVYKLFQVCLGEDCHFCGDEDPYSFRLSLIVPYWHDRFRSIEFRKYFENMVRTETPAHCMIKVCWVSNNLMNEFDRTFKEWLEALADYEKDLIRKESKKDRLRTANNLMIEIIKKLHSEYPEAHLHDCDTGVTNPVLLGNTVLGTYKF